MAGGIRIGIGGWTYAPWRGTFYPAGLAQKRELEYAAKQLTSIEINGTYYGSQKPDSFARWFDETPEDFVFAVKGPRFATNRRVLAEAGESVQRFFDSGVMRLGHKLGPINWQFMATKKFDPEDFSSFLALLPKSVEGYELRHAVEVRHESFCSPGFVTLAREQQVAIVTAGDSTFPQIADPTAPFAYLRIMGTTEAEPLGYSADALDRWASTARAISEGRHPGGLKSASEPAVTGPRDVFLYVIAGHKPANPDAAIALLARMNQGR